MLGSSFEMLSTTEYELPGGGATVATRQRGAYLFMAPSCRETTMRQHLTFVCGDNPDASLQQASLVRSDSTQLSGQWDHLVERTSGRPFEAPPTYLVLRDGTVVSQAEVGADGMRSRLLALGPTERVSILTVVG